VNSSKHVSTPLANYFKLSLKQCPKSDKKKEEMQKIPYSSIVGSSIYDMVCTRPNNAHIVGVVIHFPVNPGKEHWQVVKYVSERYFQSLFML